MFMFQLSHKRLAAQIIGIFVDVERPEFTKRLPELVPLLQQQFTGDNRPGRFVRAASNNDDEQGGDHHIFQVMQLLLKICARCPEFLTGESFQDHISLLTGEYLLRQHWLLLTHSLNYVLIIMSEEFMVKKN